MTKIIERNIYQNLKKHLKEKEITVLIGPRQTGKTTLILELYKELKAENPDKIFYFNLDRLKDLSFFFSQEEVIKFISSRIQKGKKNKIYLFVDEAQRIENAGRFFKGIYDLGLPVKLVLTGSSPLDIKDKMQESLAGRKKVFRLFTLSFSEFLKYKDKTLFQLLNQEKISNFDKNAILDFLKEFVIWGGYPAVVTENNPNKKREMLEEIYNSYVEKDAISFLKIKKPLVFRKLLQLLVFQIGQIANTNELSSSLNIENRTTEYYLDVLRETFIVKSIPPFFSNPRKELVKASKIYLLDNGLMNLAKDSFKSFDDRVDKGALLENFVASELSKDALSRKLRYWRTLHGAEVDFVIERSSGPIPIEVKTQIKKRTLGKSFVNFLSDYKTQDAFFINLSKKDKFKFKNTYIHFIYPFQIQKILKKI
ncbi:ATP-binding protein [Patescibacteria group bacterium]|nr:ATP-binding protein [Patescibacteria group bacterium]MBU4512063.1 ATP-binding protein [Patescibacteria group bacterium]